LLPDGWASNVRATFAGGAFASVERDVAPDARDFRASVGLPGLSNVHSHAFQRGMAGLTEHRGPNADSFWTWRELMYRFVGRLTPDDAEAFAAQAFMEMLEAGFTRVGEFHYLHHDPAGQPYSDLAEMASRVVAACEQTGIALTLLPVFYAHSSFGGRAPNEGQRRFICTVDLYARLMESSRALVASLPHSAVGIAPHSLRAVTPDELSAILPLADRGPIHIHAAEQIKEVEDCLAWSGKRPVQWLLDSMPVDRRWCLIHSTHVDEGEVARLAASGAVAGLCPITEGNLGDGIFPAAAFLDTGGSFGIGTDSNVLISVGQELRQLEYSQRLRDRMRNVLAGGPNRSTGRTLFDAALKGGAQAMGTSAGIAVGAPADFFSLDTRDVLFAGRSGDQLLDTFIFAGGDRCIDSVWRAGRQVVSQGRHLARAAIETRYRATLERLLRI
jgi:formiminoglutamate deiminase